MGCTSSKLFDERRYTYDDYTDETIQRAVSIHPQLVSRRNAHIYDNYILDSQELGSGVTGSVRCGTHKITKQKYAIKMIRTKYMSEENKKSLKNEINILQQLDHPNIVKLYETYESADELYLVMELCTGGELYYRLMEQHNCRYNEEEIRKVMRKLFSAVSYLHEKHIAHRDLKLSNILYKNTSSNEIKLIDFGLSKVYMNDHHIKSMNTIVGTPYYIAPEVLQEQKEGYGKTCDIWSLGVIMYMLATGKPPICGTDPNEILGNISTQEIEFSRGDFKNYSKNMLVFLKHVLDKDPVTRYTAREALNAPWLSCKDTEVNIPYIYIQSIKNYAYKYTRLKRGILLVMAYNCEAPFIYKIRDIFMDMDKDGRGRLSKQTFITALLDNDVDLQPENAEEIFKYIDEDDTEYVNYTEFIAACMPFEYINKDVYIKKVFHILDTDNTGFISFYNLKEYFKSNTIEEVLTLLNESSIYTTTSPVVSLPGRREAKEGQRIEADDYLESTEEGRSNYPDLRIDFDLFKQIMKMNIENNNTTQMNMKNADSILTPKPLFSSQTSSEVSNSIRKTSDIIINPQTMNTVDVSHTINIPKKSSTTNSSQYSNDNIDCMYKSSSDTNTIIKLNANNSSKSNDDKKDNNDSLIMDSDSLKEKSSFYSKETFTRDAKFPLSAIHVEQDSGSISSLHHRGSTNKDSPEDVIIMKEGEIIPLSL